jgi:hypothetical protein
MEQDFLESTHMLQATQCTIRLAFGALLLLSFNTPIATQLLQPILVDDLHNSQIAQLLFIYTVTQIA